MYNCQDIFYWFFCKFTNVILPVSDFYDQILMSVACRTGIVTTTVWTPQEDSAVPAETDIILLGTSGHVLVSGVCNFPIKGCRPKRTFLLNSVEVFRNYGKISEMEQTKKGFWGISHHKDVFNWTFLFKIAITKGVDSWPVGKSLGFMLLSRQKCSEIR